MFQMLRRLFPRFRPITSHVAGLGEFTNNRHGYWNAKRPTMLNGREAYLSFKTGLTPPSTREIAFYREILCRWADLWSAIILKLSNGLEDDRGEKARFLVHVHPVCITFSDLSETAKVWEVELAPDIYEGHIVTMVMQDFGCLAFRLDG